MSPHVVQEGGTARRHQLGASKSRTDPEGGSVPGYQGIAFQFHAMYPQPDVGEYSVGGLRQNEEYPHRVTEETRVRSEEPGGGDGRRVHLEELSNWNATCAAGVPRSSA